MYKQTVYGMPSKCLNRQCKSNFYKECHLGWLPKNELEVYAIVKCLKCKDAFAITQPYSVAKDYKNQLPKNPEIKKFDKFGPITLSEINDVKKTLSKNIKLNDLNTES